MTEKLTDIVPLGEMTPLEYVRRSRGLTIDDLVGMSGVCVSMISAYERGLRVPQRRNTGRRIAQALGVDEALLWPNGG